MRVVTFIICLLCLPLAFAVADTTGPVTVERMDFEGAVYLPKVALANAAGVRVEKGKLVVDPARVQQVLEKEPLLEGYSVNVSNGAMRVKISEKVPFLAIGLCTAKQTRIAELDEGLNVIALDRMYASQNPLILFGEQYLDNGRLRPEAWLVVKRVAGWKNDTALWKRLRTVDMRQPSSPVVSFSGSRAGVVLGQLPEQTSSLRLCLVALDRAGKNARQLDFFGNMAVIR